MKTIRIQLAGKKYEIQTLPIAQSRAWRQQLMQPFQLIGAILDHVDLNDLTNIANVEELIPLFKEGVMTVLGSVELLVDLLFAYSPVLEADREHIENTAHDDEAMQALMEVIKVAYPLGGLMTFLNGPKERKTSRSGR